MRLKIALALVILSLLASQSYAAISFTNGYWSTSFVGCDISAVTGTWTCDGADAIVNYDYDCGGDCPRSMVGAVANHAGGAGGSGYRVYFEGDARNDMSGMLRITFPSPPTEFWVRFYYRIPAGQFMTGALTAHKILYLYGNQDININWPYYANMGAENRTEGWDYVYGPGGNRGYSDTSYGNWATLYGGPPTTHPADGTWHCFEYYFNVGTTSNNGIMRLWVDGANVINDTTVNLGGGAGGSFASFDIPHNHNTFGLDGIQPHDVDDIAIATSTYSGFVQNTTGYATGLNMIGPLGSSSTSPTLKGITITGGSIR